MKEPLFHKKIDIATQTEPVKFQEESSIMRNHLYRLARMNHQQWGHVVGMTLGLVLGIIVSQENKLKNDISGWQLLGTVHVQSDLMITLLQICVIPLSSGLFANLFSNMGAGIDAITNKHTLLSLAVDYIDHKTKQNKKHKLIKSTEAGKIEVIKTDDLSTPLITRINVATQTEHTS